MKWIYLTVEDGEVIWYNTGHGASGGAIAVPDAPTALTLTEGTV